MDSLVNAITNLFTGKILKTLLIIFLIYLFGGVLSFFPFAFGFFTNVFTFPLDFLNNNIYPVGVIPYVFLYGGFISIVAFIIIRLFKH